MQYIQKGLSLVIVLTLFIQPVFAEDLIPDVVIPSVEATDDSTTSEVLPETPIQEAQNTEIETNASETSIEVTSVADDTEFISASVETPIVEKKAKKDAHKEIPLTETAYVSGEILVKYKDNKINLTKTAGRRVASQIAKVASLKKKDEMRESNIALLEITDTATVEEKIDELEANQNVEYAQPNFIYTPTTIATNDPSRDLLWGLDNIGQNVNGTFGKSNADINAPQAWAINEGTNASIVVAVIDTGVAYNHPDLINNMWDGTHCKDESGQIIAGGCNHGYDFEENDTTPLPSYLSHGTHIAGTIAATKNNEKGIAGVAPRAKIMAIKTSLTSDEIVKSIQFAKQNGAHIINASWGGYTSGSYDTAVTNEIASFPGLFIAAAGNGLPSINTGIDNDGGLAFYPATLDLPNIISVAATDQNDGLAYFSNYGVISVDVAAPGTNIFSTVPSVTLSLNENFDALVAPNIPTGWTKGGTSTNWGTLPDAIGDNVLYSDLSTPYTDNADTSVTSATYNLSTGGANISFLTICDTEYVTNGWNDYVQLEYSNDGGATFSPAVDPYSGEEFRWDEATLDVLNGAPFGDSPLGSGYLYENVVIPTKYLTSNFKFRFHWITNASDSNHDGCLVDDIKITKLSNGSDEQYAFSDGTSMATPHVAGLAALIEGYNPNITPAEVKAIILSTGTTTTSLAGKTVTGKRIDAQKALQVANPLVVPVISISATQVSVAATSATITWTTSHPATSRVVYGMTSLGASTSSPNYGYASSTVENSVLTTNHSVTVTGLKRGTAYFFRPVSHAVPPPVVGAEISATTPLPDTTAPVLTLSGANPMHIPKFSTFVEPGAIAIDNIDGNITNKIIYGGTITDTSIATKYTLTYTVSDTEGNSTTTNRIVFVDRLSLTNEQSSEVGAESVMLTWNTSNPATSRVLWATTTHTNVSTSTQPAPNYGYENSTVEDTALVTNHSVTINGLSPLTPYFFRPISHDTTENVMGIEILATTTATPVVTPPSRGSSSGGGGGGGGSSKSKVQINSGAKETRTRDVQLTITKVKDATQMQISNTTDFTSLSWLPFTSTYSWTLTPGNGNKTVYVRYGKNNKEVGKGKDTIILREGNGGLSVQGFPQAPQGSTVGGTSRIPATQLKFVSTLSIGSRNQEVTDLQNILIADKFLLITPATGYYGQITARAVQAYQKVHGIPQTGIVDEATRAKLNRSGTTSTNEAQKAALIKTLTAKLLELLSELKARKHNN